MHVCTVFNCIFYFCLTFICKGCINTSVELCVRASVDTSANTSVEVGTNTGIETGGKAGVGYDINTGFPILPDNGLFDNRPVVIVIRNVAYGQQDRILISARFLHQ